MNMPKYENCKVRVWQNETEVYISECNEWVPIDADPSWKPGLYVVKDGQLQAVEPAMPLRESEIVAMNNDAWLFYWNSWKDGVKHTFFYRQADSWRATLPEDFAGAIGSFIRIRELFQEPLGKTK